jgi:hypothetical protein
LDRRLDGLQSRSGRSGEEKNPHPLLGIHIESKYGAWKEYFGQETSMRPLWGQGVDGRIILKWI